MSVDKDTQIKEIRKNMSASLGGSSDHLATVHAFNSWQKSRAKVQFAYDNFLSNDALNTIDGLRRKILSELKFRGMSIDNNTLKEHASDMGLVRSLLVVYTSV